MGKIHIILTGMMLALLLALPAVPAWAGKSKLVLPLPVTHGEIIRNDARITFEWPEPVPFKATAKGTVITITFDRRANPGFGQVLTTLSPYVVSAKRKHDGKTVVLTLDRPYRIRTFLSDNVGGIELLDIDPSRSREAQAANAAIAALMPAAGDASPAATPIPATSPPAPTAPATADATTGPSVQLPAAAASPDEKTDSSALPPDEAAQQAAQEAAQSPAEPPKPATVKVNISAAEDSAVIRLPFSERMAIAAFVRSSYLWIVINKPVALDLSDFDSLPRSVIGKGEILPGKSVTILHVPVDDNIYAAVAREEKSFEWAVLLTSRKKPPANPLKISINTDPPAPAHVFIPALEMGDPVTVQDPVVGDDLVVTPLYSTGDGIPFQRDFVEFSLLQSAEGVVVAKKADAVTVATLRNGLRISLPQGATLTPGLPEVQNLNTTESLQNAATLYPYDNWKPDAETPRRAQLRVLFHKVVESGNVQEANDARRRMAEIYLSDGLAPEALGLLDGISRTSPTYYRSAKLAAMRGAANFLMYRFSDSAHDFAAAELNNNKEMAYWRNMLDDLLGNNTGQYDYLALNDDYISKYPPTFRQRLAIVAADRAIDTKEYNTALKIFDSLHSDNKEENLLGPINHYVNYLLAKISTETGQVDEGLEMWDKLAEDYRYPFVQARAEFSRIAWGLGHGPMTKDEVIDRLERLRLSWHGDNLELKVVMLLGDLYAEKKDFVNAMRIWDDGINSFANTPNSIDMSHRMEEAFISLFKEGIADSMPTLDALTLYYQYRKYSPPGNVGREMIERLADRLVSIDLLDQAAALLDHQMHFESEKVQRSQLGTKVATIRLMDHDPKKALKALEDSVYGENPVTLRMLRNRLTAQAMSETDQPDKALVILGQDDSVDAERIRINIYWQKKDWERVVSSVEAMLKARKDATAPITLDESEYIIELAMAYVFENNGTQLQYLRDYFGPLMANNPNKPMFDFVTAGDNALTTTNFDDVIKNLSDTRSFLSNYHAHIKSEGLKAIMPPGTAAK